MSKKPLDPNLASILDSIRATVGGETPPQSREAMEAMLDAEAEAGAEPTETVAEADGGTAKVPDPSGADRPLARSAAPAAKPGARKAIPPATRTVEEFLAELIRPQVEAWLSAHLPEIIQKQAAEEIARLTGRK
jgi:cell pole-organizing protein PopZ